MNRAELLAKIGRQLNKSSTLDSLTKARLLDHVNGRHREILSAPGCQALRRRQTDVTSIIGRSRYAIYNGENIKWVRDTTNDRLLTQRSLGAYRQQNPDPINSPGTPDGYVPYGFEPVERQPTDVDPVGSPAGTWNLFAVSTSAADTTQTVYVEGSYPTGGTTATLSGLTPVALGNFGHVSKFYLSALPTGIISLTLHTGTGTQLTALIQQTSVRWLAFYLDPTPSAALPYEIDAEFAITDLAQDTDEPWIPSDFQDVLETGALIDELVHLDDNRLVVFQRQYDRRLGELKLKLARMGSDTGPRGRTSRLGPWTEVRW